ncbi:hypothetical protein H4217_006161 [Coemansia sp. RSA 1939]|nr:hypothetical protein H4217_006161 [Coemansia sp. RSA 1939]KAJ2603733.1 hypothetical protein EV177_006631 [Coemansia sp. RSA 1804]
MSSSNGFNQTLRPWRPTQQESRAYNQVYCHLDKERRGIVQLADVRSLIGNGAHIHPGFVRNILRLAVANGNSNGAESETVTRREFYVAMKMVSLLQSGRPVSLLNLCESAPLPRIDGINLQKSKSSVLSYAPEQACSSSSSSINSNRRLSSSSEDDGSLTDRSSISTINSAGLYVDTKLAEQARAMPSAFGVRTPVSTDSVTDLLCRIDEVVSSTCESRIRRRATENELNSASSLRAELEERMTQLQLVCQKESDENSALAERLQLEESRIDAMQEQVKRMQNNIAYIARQRLQLVERLQQTEDRQQYLEEQLEQLQQQQHQQQQSKNNGREEAVLVERDEAAGGLAPRPTVSRRYETARRNRLSSVFVKPV